MDGIYVGYERKESLYDNLKALCHLVPSSRGVPYERNEDPAQNRDESFPN